MAIKVWNGSCFRKDDVSCDFEWAAWRYSSTISKQCTLRENERNAFFRNFKSSGETPSMFRECTEHFLSCSINHADSRLSTCLAKIRGRPGELEINIERQSSFVRVCGTIGAKHLTVFNQDVRAGCGTVPSRKIPTNR